MSETLSILIGVFGGVVAGCGLSALVLRVRVGRARETAHEILEKAYHDAEALLKNAEIESKRQSYERQLQLEDEVRERRLEIQRLDQRLLDREESLDQRQTYLDRKEREYDHLSRKFASRERMLKALEERMRSRETELLERLAELGKLRVEDARRQLMAQVAVEARYDAAQLARRVEEEMRDTLNQRARRLLATAIERCAADFVSESAVVAVPLPNEEMKGRIIGKEGRNIRTFETITGVDLIVDETPEAILVSCFDPLRREVARRALEALIQDGRIHPSRIEQMVAIAQEEAARNALTAAREVVSALELPPFADEIIEMLARLRYRSSFGQNLLEHSKDVAILASTLAAELGENALHARRAGLLHDIGKATEHFVEGNHVDVALSVLRRYGEPVEVLHAIEAHHEAVEARSVIAVLLQIADRVSAARPGARRGTLDAYVRRLQHLEEIAHSFEGVERAYAIHAGRELRVIVEAIKVDDANAYLIAKDVARRIQSEVQFAGQVQVTVIRETRATAVARPISDYLTAHVSELPHLSVPNSSDGDVC
jgi:ribonuclease Y